MDEAGQSGQQSRNSEQNKYFPGGKKGTVGGGKKETKNTPDHVGGAPTGFQNSNEETGKDNSTVN